MKNIKFKFSLIFIILGICIITISKIVEEIVPKLGFAAYQSAAAGSFSHEDYYVNLTLNYWIGALCILSGIIYLIKSSNIVENQIAEIKLRNKELEERFKNNQQE
ncbi:hypothetical protein J40TS1_38020 [Paenibacillus montaniterrae]|uniref:Uncharacterized protein n=1 Tax=Paenibacillus montaniterrae TaxID=429341 RepID=A0A919YRM7_9BACL|nr:hypothetical protein [Paenibacillus montaniterrae]GIP18160.1 hypothetical protein J40TS1_38020 [Paenibacillus montaniterrae]